MHDDMTAWSRADLAALIDWRGFVSPERARLIHAACCELGRRIEEGTLMQIGDEIEVYKPGDANHGREGKVARAIEPPQPSSLWPTRRWEVEFEGGQEKAEYPEFSLRPVGKVARC